MQEKDKPTEIELKNAVKHSLHDMNKSRDGRNIDEISLTDEYWQFKKRHMAADAELEEFYRTIPQ